MSFKNESKAISVLNHDSIIKVIDFSITDSEKYLVVEYIDGVTLKEFMDNRGKLSWEDTLVFANIILSESMQQIEIKIFRLAFM